MEYVGHQTELRFYLFCFPNKSPQTTFAFFLLQLGLIRRLYLLHPNHFAMTSSTFSSRSFSHKQTVGIPSQYCCEAKLMTFGAQTQENLYRQIYR